MTNAESPQQTTPSTIDRSFLQAIARHQAGQLPEAEELYRTILQAEPNHPDTNYNMGVLTMQQNQPAAGLPYFLAALDADPACGQYWLGYIDALFQAGQLDDARQVLALARQQGLDGDEADALVLRLEAGAIQPNTPINSPETGLKKQGKSAKKHGREPGSQEINSLLTLFNDGRYAEALPLAKMMTEHYPAHSFGWKALGVVFKQMGRTADALAPMQKAAALSPNDAEAHNNLGITFQDLGRLKDAEASYRRAIKIDPNHAQAHSNLGSTLQALGRLTEAETCYKRALLIDPHYARALVNLGAALHDMGRLDEAEASYRQALQIRQDNAEAHYNLSITLKELGQPVAAETSCRQALLIKPDYVDAHFNLGNIFYDLGRLDEAETSYRRTLQIKPDFVGALNNLALLFNVQGRSMLALDTIKQSLQIEETEEAKSIFVDCVKRMHFTHEDKEIQTTLVRALTEPWGRTSELARTSTELVKLNPYINECVVRATNAWPLRLSAESLFGANGITPLAGHLLLYSLLDSAPACDVEMERFLTLMRCAMLETATMASDSDDDRTLAFYGVLARQCFINEYVFSYTDDEIQKAGDLRDLLTSALKTGDRIPALWLVAVAAYFPLCSLSIANRLLERQWPGAVTAVLLQQVREPAEEKRLRSTITRLTDIEDEVSLLVQNQYEENPYPRWIKTAPAGKAKNLIGYLSQKFPQAPFRRHVKSGCIDVLIAGCGTGQQPIASAQRILGAKLLAVDLSLSSLGYAKRKTDELGLTSIEYAQADLLKLGSLERRFDIIESSGVLHHLANPWTGWQVLLSLLRPGGFMKLGFYSEVARQDVVRIRTFISERGYTSTPEDIRRCRQDLMAMDKNTNFGAILKSPDFFSISTCRDLLFHVQEHRLTLTDIEAFLRDNDLTFLGFEIEINALHAYKQRFPDDHAATNLGQWQIFEHENPDTFANMYQFWIQNNG